MWSHADIKIHINCDFQDDSYRESLKNHKSNEIATYLLIELALHRSLEDPVRHDSVALSNFRK